MPAPDAISPDKLAKLIGTPRCPVLIDMREEDDFTLDRRMVPGARRLDAASLPVFAEGAHGQAVIAICRSGHAISQGAAAWLRTAGIRAEYLEGGHAAWTEAGLPTVDPTRLPGRDAEGRTTWVTRARPKIDRIACPWLIRRFFDPGAVFLFVAPSEVETVGRRFGAAPFDIEGTFWSHRDQLCSFDVMLAETGLSIPALDRVARIVRGADTARLDLEPEAAGLLAISLGLSRMHADDLEQLEAGMAIYDALYRWARDATSETHNWPGAKPGTSK